MNEQTLIREDYTLAAVLMCFSYMLFNLHMGGSNAAVSSRPGTY